MSNQEFETKRTALANAFAVAGAELLAYLAIADTVVAEIPDTQPQKYAVAGTLNGILSMAGKMMGEDGAEQPTGDLPPLPEPDDVDHVRWAYTADSMRDYARAAIASHIASQPKAEQPGDDDQYAVIVDRRDLFDFLRAAWRAGQDFFGPMTEQERWERATNYANAEIKGWSTMRPAHLVRQAQAEPVAPAILEAISWHARERDDLTLEEAVEAFRFGYKKVRQREDRAMLLQLIHLMASAPAGAQNAEAIRNQASPQEGK
jgi:hypothetical protein